MCFSLNFFNACLNKNSPIIRTELNKTKQESLEKASLKDEQILKDKEVLKYTFESRLNSIYQNLLDNQHNIVLDLDNHHIDKLSLISSSSSTLSSLNSSITNLSLKMQSDNCKKFESLIISDHTDKPRIAPKPNMNTFNFTPRTPNKLDQPELKIEKLNAKKQAYHFNSGLVPKPLELEEENTIILDDTKKKSSHQHTYKSRGGKLTFSAEQVYEFNESDIKELGQIGNGEFGTVLRVLHKPSRTQMAMKRIGPTVGNQGERKKVLKELAFVLECHDYDYVVKFYGVKFNNEPADCLICMELMDASLDKFYRYIYEVKKEELPESFLGKVCVATVNALNYLKESHKIIHRDVKPSNILVNRQGNIKMCDFGISGKLVDSIAASRDAGCQLYMAPERIDPVKASEQGYDVRSDVWSLGITLFELATGKFPYPQWKSIFHQLSLVVEQDAPRLQSNRLSNDFKNFVNTCLTKDEKLRPKYNILLQDPLIIAHTNTNNKAQVAAYVEPYINEMNNLSSNSNVSKASSIN